MAAARLTEAYTDACSGSKLTDEWFGYDADGNVTQFYESTPHSSGYYQTKATYWANGAMDILSALNSSSTAIFPAVYYGSSTGGSTGDGIDGEGRITKVYAASGTNPATSATYVNSGTTEPIGVLTGVTLGSSDSDSFTFDPNTGRQKTYTFSVNGKNNTGTLTWNANGTLGKFVIADSFTGTTDSQTCNYYYDDLARLGGKDANGYSADCGSGKWQQLFTFDAFGNITKSGSLSFAPTYYASPPTNQFSSIPGVTVSYDKNGNLLTDNLNTYTWDPNWGNPASINGTNLIYDAQGRMVEQQKGSTYTQMLYSQVGKTAIMNGQTLTKAFVYLPGGATAIYNSTGPAYYRHADWLGSSRVTSTAARGVYSDSAYAPFGEQYDATGTADASFTGQNDDTVSSLFDFTFREYSPSQGRWISPDPSGTAAADPTNPQSWNRYAYVLNNPLLNIDPDGLDCVYLNDDGNAVQSIDSNSNPDECSGNDNGGYWVPGTNVQVTSIDQNNGAIGAYSVDPATGFIMFTASTNNAAGIDVTTVGVGVAATIPNGNVYTSEDDMSPTAQRYIRAIAAAAPTFCGGGVFGYGGRSLDLGPAHSFVGGVIEADSVSGISKGTLFEGGGGEGVTGGGGLIVASNGDGTVGSESLAYGGAGFGIPGAHVGTGLVGFTSGGLGFYGEVSAGGREVGGGAYLNITTNAGCKKR